MSCETLLISRQDGMFVITMNRPEKKNAFTMKGYTKLAQAIAEGCADECSKFIVLTGQGSFYSSGNDIGNAFSSDFDPDDPNKYVRTLVSAFIEATKPIVAIVNGPAIGIAATTLGLCDTVYATESAYLLTPFSSLGLCAEGCASYLFPKIMGYQKANELLLWGKKVSATEACQMGLVTQVFPDADFQREVKERLTRYSKLPKGSLAATKFLTRCNELETLKRVNVKELEVLRERAVSEESQQAIMDFMNRPKRASKL